MVSALASKGAHHIPYRDSKLTRLLQSSIGGNCKAAIVVTLRTEPQNVEESIGATAGTSRLEWLGEVHLPARRGELRTAGAFSLAGTMKFAQRAKSVQATVVKNDVSASPVEANQKLEQELAAAKAHLAKMQARLDSAAATEQQQQVEVETLLSEVSRLQQDGERAAGAVPRGRKMSIHADPAALALAASPYVRQLESGARVRVVTAFLIWQVRQLEERVAALEQENRLLRQRDIMQDGGRLDLLPRRGLLRDSARLAEDGGRCAQASRGRDHGERGGGRAGRGLLAEQIRAG